MNPKGRKRSIRSYLVEPFQQIRFGLYVVVICFIYILLFTFLFARAFQELYQQILQTQIPAATDIALQALTQRNSFVIGIVLLAFISTIILVVVVRTHRMYGPIISMERFIHELIQGNYSARLRTRESDDFKNLVQKLNELAIELQRKNEPLDIKKNDTSS